ncbi:MAG: hypothetical protein QOK57_09765, partial [Nitrososphaeraceae archaeon]|nr:hypothetical protein [Nitrososphaeraceae archaeon]
VCGEDVLVVSIGVSVCGEDVLVVSIGVSVCGEDVLVVSIGVSVCGEDVLVVSIGVSDCEEEVCGLAELGPLLLAVGNGNCTLLVWLGEELPVTLMLNHLVTAGPVGGTKQVIFDVKSLSPV